jgi:hypothetical protein
MHLQRMIHLQNAKIHWPQQENAKLCDHVCQYHVMLNGKKLKVCQKVFISLYAISDKKSQEAKIIACGKKGTTW